MNTAVVKGEDVTRLELLTFLMGIKAMLENSNAEKAREMIDKLIAEAEKE